MLALLLACSPTPTAAPRDPCTPVEAVFFDLGETLVTDRGDGSYDTVPGAEELLDALEGLPTGIVTNMRPGDTREDLEALLVDPSLLDRFDVVLLSSLAESDPKPAPEIFGEALALLEGPPPIEQVVFVTEEIGDLADAEVPTEGARAAGMVGVHVSDEEPSPLADHTVAPDALPSIATAAWMECLEG